MSIPRHPPDPFLTCPPESSDRDKEAAPMQPQPKKVKRRTVGNIIYDWGIYTSVAWGGVAVLSLLSAHEAMHGKHPWFNWLRSLNNNVAGGLKNILSRTILRDRPQEVIDGYANGTTMFVTLGMGGNALAWVIRWLEGHRERNAGIIDNFLGTRPPDPELIAAEIPQTAKSVLTGRLTSWGLSYAAFLAMGPKLTGKVSKFFGEHATNAWMRIRPQSNPAAVRRWADIGAFDTTFTGITATSTYGISRVVAWRDHKKLEAEDALYAANPSVPAATEPEFYNKLPADYVRGLGRAETYRKPSLTAAQPSSLHIEKLTESEITPTR